MDISGFGICTGSGYFIVKTVFLAKKMAEDHKAKRKTMSNYAATK